MTGQVIERPIPQRRERDPLPHTPDRPAPRPEPPTPHRPPVDRPEDYPLPTRDLPGEDDRPPR
jgi:hypothetical protein